MSTEKPGTPRLLEEITAGKWIVGDGAPKELPLKRGRIPRHFVIVGTSGSHDYLTDSTDGQRFWPIHVATPPPAPNERQTFVRRLLALGLITGQELEDLTSDAAARNLNNSCDEDDGAAHTEDP